ncbi:MAG TPA: energy transducer TonB, partial [Polyangiaceae bacterium]|nr:energy transducer TonB [Polyangiaceae bacterium]
MVCRWLQAALLLGLVCAARPTFAQSLSIEQEQEQEQPEEPKPAEPGPKTAPAPAPARPPVIVLPVAKATPLEYPLEGKGEASVALELTLTAEGVVMKATAIEGDEPFTSQAVKAAGSWQFEPATRDGKPIPAKIRFLVRFVPPREVLEPEVPAEAPAAATPGTKPGEPAKPAEPAYEITVLGERAPIRHELARVEIARMPGAFGDPYRAI